MLVDHRIYGTLIIVSAALYVSAPVRGWLHPWHDKALVGSIILLGATILIFGLDWLWS